MTLDIRIPKLIPKEEHENLHNFAQSIINRYAFGHARYGSPRKEKQYLTRMGLERAAYRKTGNREHLYNIAVYCLLEAIAPENEKHHFDPTVGSVTRGKVKETA